MSRIERIGDATLYLGDCLEILPTLGKVDAVVTDPPYGVNIGYHHSANENRAGLLSKGGYSSYQDTPENYSKIVVPALSIALDMTKRGAIFGVPPNIWKLRAPDAIGGIFVAGAVGRNRWGWSTLIHCCLYGTAPNLQRGAKPTAISGTATAEPNGHPTPKPESWMRWCVDLASTSGETVVDPFMGSGTTGVACAKLGRKFIGIEIDERYFEIACRRIAAAYAEPRLPLAEPQRRPEPSLLPGM